MTFVFCTLFFFLLWWSISDSCALSLIFLTTFSNTFESDEWWGMGTKSLSQCKERHIQSHPACSAMFTWPFVKVWVAVLFDYNIGKYLLYWIGDCHLIFIPLLFLVTDFLILCGLCVQTTYDMIIMLFLYLMVTVLYVINSLLNPTPL